MKLIKLVAKKKLVDKRNGKEYSVVVCKEQDQKYFEEKN